MKVFKSYNKVIVSFLYFLIFTFSTSTIIWMFVHRPRILVISSILFALFFAIIFELQKPKMAISLNNRLFPNDKGTIFFYDEGRSYDFAESFLIINSKSIIICTCYSQGQRLFNRLIKKQTMLDILLHANIIYIKLIEDTNDIIIHDATRETIIEKFDYLSQFEDALLVNGYVKTNNTYKKN